MEHTPAVGGTDTLVDIRDVTVDRELSREDRIAEFVRQIKNPYRFSQFIKPLPRNGLCLIKVVGETALHRLGVSLQITAQPYGHIQKFLAITR